MDLNKIKALTKDELIQKLKQCGFEKVGSILEDKNINGQTILGLAEIDIFKWRLNLSEKRYIWECIKKIKEKPSILMVQPKPQYKPKPAKAKYMEDIEGNKFKNKLQDLLGASATSVGSSSTLPKLRTPRPSHTIPTENKVSSKPLPPPPPPSPPPRNNNVKNTNIDAKKTAMPLPKIANSKNMDQETDDAYLEMSTPAVMKKEPEIDYYLSPINVPSTLKNQNRSPNLPKKKVGNEMGPVDEAEEAYENLENTYELSPPGNIIKESRSPNMPKKKYLVEKSTDEDVVDYEQFPNEACGIGHANVPKSTLKDLAENVVIIEDNSPQQESKFSFLTSKLNIFKSITKPKNIYENYKIQSESVSHVEIPPVQNRPLPQIPVSPTPARSRAFSRPLPLPRKESTNSNSGDNYVELSSAFPVMEPASVSQETDNSDDENQIYENAAKAQVVDEDEQLIYENASKTEHSDDEEQIYENRPAHSDDEEQIYENRQAAHGRNPPPTKKYVGEIWSQQVPHRDFKAKENPENSGKINEDTKNPVRANENTDHVQPPRVHSLALLLSQKLMERDQRQQRQHVESETDSEFDEEELPVYGNISVDNDNSHPSPIPEEKIIEDPPRLEEKKTPIYNRALPEIPKKNTSANNAAAGISPPSVNKRRDSFKDQTVSNRNINNPMKVDRTVNANSKLAPGPSKVIFSNYEHHTMKQNKGNENRQRPGIPVPNEEEDHGDSIFNLSEEPFYRNTNRKGAKQILSQFGNGAFLFRPSQTYFLVLTVKHNNKIYNFGIERSRNNKLRLITEGNMESPEFSTLREFVNYFTEEPVTFENSEEIVEIYLKPYLQNNLP